MTKSDGKLKHSRGESEYTCVNTGTVLGYEDYRGLIVQGKRIVASWNYDKRQGRFICKFRGKFIYRNTREGLRNAVVDIINRKDSKL